MPTTKPRLNLTLDPDTSVLIDRLSQLRDVPRSRIVTDLIEAIKPQLTNLADMMELVKRAPNDLAARYGTMIDRAYAQLAPIADAANVTSETLQTNLEDAIAEAIERTARDAEQQVAPTP